MNTEKARLLQHILDKITDGKKIFGTSFAIKQNEFTWQGTSGNLTEKMPYFIASTTKLFTTAIILNLRAKGKLNLDDKISRFLNASTLRELHIYKGVEYSDQLVIRHLLAHTSGLSDYFQDKGNEGKSLEDELKEGKDQYWTFEQAIEKSKKMVSHFVPDSKGKAHYSDTNFQLLGKIIEEITQKSYAENCQEMIINPLGLSQTYLYQNPADTTPKTLFYKDHALHIPKAMASFGSDGGIVSTSAEMLIFIEAFFTGKLFPKAYLDELQVWNKIFFPVYSGIGILLVKLPWFFNPFGRTPYFIGHAGLSGAVAFYCPKENIFIAGTTNQVAYPDIAFKTMIKLVEQMLRI